MKVKMNRALSFALVIALVPTLLGCEAGREATRGKTALPREAVATPIATPIATQSPRPVEKRRVSAAAQSTQSPASCATVQIHLATEESLSRFASVHEFIEFDDEGYQKIVLTTDVAIHDFRFIDIGGGDFDAFYDDERVLFSIDVLTPDMPFVVTWMEWGSLPHRGISYWDANHSQRFLCIGQSGKDGSLLLTEPTQGEQQTPQAYEPILDALLLLQENMRLEQYGEGEDLEAVGFAEYPHPRDSALGYALADINGDGVIELLLGTTQGLAASSPHSIFTLNNGQPVLLASFWSRNRGVIASDGIVYSVGSGGASSTYLASYALEEGAIALTQLTDIYSGDGPAEGEIQYVQFVDGESVYLTEQQFSAFCEMYENPPDVWELTVLPIAQQR